MTRKMSQIALPLAQRSAADPDRIVVGNANRTVIEALGALSVVWSVGLSVLGVYVYKRSGEKALAAGSPQPGLLDGLRRLAGRG